MKLSNYNNFKFVVTFFNCFNQNIILSMLDFRALYTYRYVLGNFNLLLQAVVKIFRMVDFCILVLFAFIYEI